MDLSSNRAERIELMERVIDVLEGMNATYKSKEPVKIGTLIDAIMPIGLDDSADDLADSGDEVGGGSIGK